MESTKADELAAKIEALAADIRKAVLEWEGTENADGMMADFMTLLPNDLDAMVWEYRNL